MYSMYTRIHSNTWNTFPSIHSKGLQILNAWINNKQCSLLVDTNSVKSVTKCCSVKCIRSLWSAVCECDHARKINPYSHTVGMHTINGWPILQRNDQPVYKLQFVTQSPICQISKPNLWNRGQGVKIQQFTHVIKFWHALTPSGI